jgi:hypothetical protein
MTIPGQQTINIGQPNDSANSDSLYTAFNIIQNNFTELFTTAGQVQSVVAGNGIAISNSNSSTFVVTNTGVTSLIAGQNVTITTLGGSPGSNGALLINSTGTGNGGGGSVNSVGITSGTLSVTNSPIISSGNISVNLPNISPSVSGSYSSANIVVDQYGRVTSASNGSGSGTVTSVSVTGGTGLSVSGSPITTSGTIAITNTGVTSIVAGSGVSINQSNGAVTISATGSGGGGTGTVTRVGVLSNTLTITGSPITTSGNITVDLPSNLSVSSLNVTTPNSNTGITISTSSNDANLFGISMKKSRGSNVSPTAVQTSDKILNIQSSGYTSYNQYQSGGGINIIANGSASSGSSYIPSVVNIYSTDNDGLKYNLRLDDDGILTIPGEISQHIYSNIATQYTMAMSRARGTDNGNVYKVEIDDDIFKVSYQGYTGNGLLTINSISGWSFAGSTEMQVIALPQSSGAYIPVAYRIKTVSTSNTINTFTFGSTGNLLVPNVVIANTIQSNGNVNGSNASLGNLVTANYYSGVLTTASQPNITSVGTLSSLSVTNDVTAGNVYANSGTIGASLLIGTITTNAQPNITSVGTLSSVSVTNNITAGNVYANSGTIGASLLTGTITTNAQPNITSVGTLSSLSVTNDVIAGNVYANSGNIRGTTLTAVGNVNSGNASLGNLATANFFTGTLTTNAQPNITSVGTLSSLNVTGNISAGNVNISGNIVSNTVGTPTFVSTTSITLQGTTVVNVTGGAVFRLPKLTTIQKTAITAVNGDILYDTDLNKFQGYENGAWGNLI